LIPKIKSGACNAIAWICASCGTPGKDRHQDKRRLSRGFHHGSDYIAASLGGQRVWA